MTLVPEGSRWLLWKRVLVATGDRRDGQYGNVEVLLVPEEKDYKPRWTDWVEEFRVERYGIPLAPGETVEVQRRATATEVAQAAADTARRRKPLTPEKRLANRITSTRYRMKNPEKSKRDSWTPEEIREMQATIDATVEELRALKENR